MVRGTRVLWVTRFAFPLFQRKESPRKGILRCPGFHHPFGPRFDSARV